MDEKIKTGTLRFPAKENPNMGKALFDWPKHSIAVKANLVKPIKPLMSILPLFLINCQQTPLSNDELLDLARCLTFSPPPRGTNLAELSACRHFLDTRSNKHIPTETLCDLLRMILTMNNFTLNQQHYLQIHCTAMGTKMAPSFAKGLVKKYRGGWAGAFGNVVDKKHMAHLLPSAQK